MPTYTESQLRIMACPHPGHDRATFMFEGVELELLRCHGCSGLTLRGCHGLHLDMDSPDANRGLLALVERAIESYRIQQTLMHADWEGDPRWERGGW